MSTFGPRTEWTIAAVDDAPSGGRKGTFVRLLLHTTSPSTDHGSGAPRQALRRLRRARLAWQGGVGGTCWGPRARSSRGEGASESAHARALSCEGWVLAGSDSGQRQTAGVPIVAHRRAPSQRLWTFAGNPRANKALIAARYNDVDITIPQVSAHAHACGPATAVDPATHGSELDWI